jgi:hypothetical protein
MHTVPRPTGGMTSRKGEAKPPPKPALRRQRGLSRRAGTNQSRGTDTLQPRLATCV